MHHVHGPKSVEHALQILKEIVETRTTEVNSTTTASEKAEVTLKEVTKMNWIVTWGFNHVYRL